jgi:hypothetical protein
LLAFFTPVESSLHPMNADTASNNMQSDETVRIARVF